MTRILTTITALLFLAGGALAHGGDDHAHEDEPAAAAAGPVPQVEIDDGKFELVALVSGRTLTIYLDSHDTNAPVSGAAITVKVDGIAAGSAAPGAPGTYTLAAPWADEPGSKAVAFDIAADGAKSVLAGTLQIAAATAAETAADVTLAALLGAPSTWMIAGFAAAVGFVLAFALRPRPISDAEPASRHTASGPKRLAVLALLALPLLATHPAPLSAHGGDDHAHGEPGAAVAAAANVPRRLPDGDVYLPKATQRLLHVRTIVATQQKAHPSRELIGTVISDPSSFGQVQAPMDGRIELAERGISHIGQRVEAGEILAYLSPNIPIADLGTMQQLTAEVAGKLKIAEQKLARLTRIASVVAQREIDDTRAELDALREQQRVLAPKDAERIALKAPVAGVISVANVRAGQVVTTRETLFEIVDPHRLWIEAISGAEHAAPRIAGAYANDTDGHSIKLSYLGRAPALRQQTQPLQFTVDERHDGLVIGSAVKVFVQQGEPVEGIVLPDEAIVRGPDALPRVWTKTGPQSFRPQPVRFAPLDGNSVVVLAGVDSGSRVVVDGAELLNQVR